MGIRSVSFSCFSFFADIVFFFSFDAYNSTYASPMGLCLSSLRVYYCSSHFVSRSRLRPALELLLRRVSENVSRPPHTVPRVRYGRRLRGFRRVQRGEPKAKSLPPRWVDAKPNGDGHGVEERCGLGFRQGTPLFGGMEYWVVRLRLRVYRSTCGVIRRCNPTNRSLPGGGGYFLFFHHHFYVPAQLVVGFTTRSRNVKTIWIT